MTEQRVRTRKETTPINVWVTPEEKAQIDALAQQTGHSMSSLLRCLGMGHQPPSILDSKMILELAKINGDQGRLVVRSQADADQAAKELAAHEVSTAARGPESLPANPKKW